MSLQSKIEDFISSQSGAYADLTEDYLNMGQLYDKKLWFELTEVLLKFVKNQGNFRGDNMIQLYHNFIKYFEDKLNQLSFAFICSHIAKQYYPSLPCVSLELDNAIRFLQEISGAGVKVEPLKVVLPVEVNMEENTGATETKGDDDDKDKTPTVSPEEEARNVQIKELEKKRTKLTQPGFLVMLCSVTSIRLEAGDVDAVKFLLDEAEEILGNLTGADPSVYGIVYLVKAKYHSKVGPASSFYEAALQYLAYTPFKEVENVVGFATDLAVAALIGDGVYNFGEVLATPILDAISGTPFEWLGELIRSCNAGDIKKFNNICSIHMADIDAHPGMSLHLDDMKKKISLLALVELVFHRPANDRILSFSDIAAATSLPIDQVEWLVMKAMSIELIKGVIDEIDQVVRVSWVQPRVLDDTQMLSLKEKLSSWGEVANNTLMYVKNNTGELLITN